MTTNGSGNVSFTKMVPKITGEPHFTATATDPNGNTSEFSPALGELLNISTREKVLTGNSVLIGGFIVTATSINQSWCARWDLPLSNSE